MKKLKLLIVLSIASSILLGQTRPAVVDNSQWFPPARAQHWNSCTAWAMVYGLKSYIWNRALERDPSQEENQFSPYFIWNQIIDPVIHMAGYNDLIYNFLAYQGASTVRDFDGSTDREEIPSLRIRKEALSHRSWASIIDRPINQGDPGNPVYRPIIERNIEALKDSLNQGTCFVINFLVFPHFTELYGQSPALYSYREDIHKDSVSLGKHVVVVVGYDDNLGGFKCLNSYGPGFGEQGFFYLDYNWFLVSREKFSHSYKASFLLEEKPTYRPESILSMKLNNWPSGEDRSADYAGLEKMVKIVDTLIQHPNDSLRKSDFEDGFINSLVPSFSHIAKVNGKNLSRIRTNRLLWPAHNHDGNYDLVADLTQILSQDFESLEIVLQDPRSGRFIAKNGLVVTEYKRNPIGEVGYAKIEFANGQRVLGRVTDLRDTIITSRDYYAGGSFAMKEATCQFARKRVTFRVEDLMDNQPPVFVNRLDTLIVPQNNELAYQFEVDNPDYDELSWTSVGSGGELDPITGLFTFKSREVGDYDFVVTVSDGTFFISDSFTVRVALNQPPVFTATVDTLRIYPESPGEGEFLFQAEDPEGESLKYALTSGRNGIVSLTSGLFTFSASPAGDYPFTIRVADKINKVYHDFIVIVRPEVNYPPLLVAMPDTLVVYQDSLVIYQLQAEDPEGDSLTFAVEGAGATIDPITGWFSYRNDQAGSYSITVFVTDGENMVNASFIVIVDELVKIEGEKFSIPTKYALSQNYPNPFNPSTVINFALPRQGFVTLRIYNLIGQEVTTLISEILPAGHHAVTFNAFNLSSGLYIYILESGDFRDIKKMVLLR